MKKKAPSPPQQLRSQILSLLKDPAYLPLNQAQLFKKLKLPSEDYSLAKEVLADMVQKKEISLKKSKIQYTPSSSPIVRGILRMNPRGFGFIVPDCRDEHPEDIFIPKNSIGTAVDGDLVEATTSPSIKKDKGPEGKIVCILERGRSHLAGLVKSIAPSGELYLHSPFLGNGKQIKAPSPASPLRLGDRVIVKVIDWGGANHPILAEITHHLGHISDPSIDVVAATEEFSLKKDFPPEVLEEVKQYGPSVSRKHYKERLDLRDLECFTIDPKTAKDFDDALSLTQDDRGHYQLGVHIADVAHYVKPGSALDAEAKSRCNSTYFPGECLPMLPEGLSNHLCSLKPKVARLCVSVLMTFNAQGDLIGHEIQRTVIKSQHRFTYEEAKEVLDGKKKSKHLPTLKKMVELCLLLKKKRYERGSIDFSLPEVVLDIDPEGMPTSYHIVEYDITHQLVEECMLKANEVVAKHLASHGTSLIFRIHEEPNPDNIGDFFSLARSLGFSVPANPTSEDIQALFKQAKETSFSTQLSIAFIRSMKLASYSPENVGHFGLSLDEYCHFTSPIRRYPDLIIQRLLFGELPPGSDLTSVAELCSEKERISFKAEQTVKTLKKLRLLQSWHRKNPHKEYQCFISKIKPFGLTFELSPLGVEGFLHVSELNEDYFIYEETKNSLFGKHSHIRFCVGDPIEVNLLNVDLVLLETRWQKKPFLPLSAPKTAPQTKKRKRRKKR